jgi:integrase
MSSGRHLVRRNVSALVNTPRGREGRPSQALTLDQAAVLLEAAEDFRLHGFIVLCLLTGVRSEEARALTWEHVDLDAGTISVWRSVRAHGDTKTNRSRRTLKLPEIAVDALRAQKRRQAEERSRAGKLWQEHGLEAGLPEGHRGGRTGCALGAEGAADLVRQHDELPRRAGRGDPRLAGHASSRTTEVIYQRELRPVITTGAEVMDQIFRPRQVRRAGAGAAR